MVMLTADESVEFPLSNSVVAQKLDDLAELLDAQSANAFRVKAYRTAADTIRRTGESLASLIDRAGLAGLMSMPGIGRSLAKSIDHLVHTGELPLLNQLRGVTKVESLLSTIPGIGSVMASRIHDELGIDSLGELQAAAYDGRLATLAGFGNKKIRAIRECLAGRFSTTSRLAPKATFRDEHAPSVSELLDLDQEYRRKAAADRLLRIAPHRFNPTGQAWLPILHTHRGDRHYTVMYTNTARAHELGTTHDWVVIVRDDHDGHGQWTVITSRFGKLKDQRIVRGRETECAEFYQAHSSDKNSLFT